MRMNLNRVKGTVHGLALVVLLAIAGCAYAPRMPDVSPVTSGAAPGFDPRRFRTVAVLVNNRCEVCGTTLQVSHIVDTAFVVQLQRKGYLPVARSTRDFDAIVTEHAFQKGGFTEGEAVRMGRMLKAQAVLLVSVNQLGAPRETGNRDYRRRGYQLPNPRNPGYSGGVRIRSSGRGHDAVRDRNVALGVTALVIGGYSYRANYKIADVSLDARLLDVEKGILMWSGDAVFGYTIRRGREGDLIRFVASELASEFPGRGRGRY